MLIMSNFEVMPDRFKVDKNPQKALITTDSNIWNLWTYWHWI